jgi:hypothetical protein
MTGIWKTLMDAFCWLTIAFGVIFAAAGFERTSAPASLFYDLVYWPLDGKSAFAENIRFTVAIMGCVMIGWGVTLYGVVHEACKTSNSPLWRSLTFGVMTWFMIDSTLSVVSGVPMNAVANLGFLFCFIVPVIGSGVLKQG